MLNQTDGCMGGWMWIWTVIGVLVVLLLNVDNTLLDNDRFASDPGARLQQAFGAAERERFFALKWVVAQTEGDLDAGASAGIAKLEAQ